MLTAKEPKVQYSENDAAQILGISVQELRTLVKNHISKEDELGNGAVSVFQPADLVVLRILSGMSSQTTASR
jgi:hypothetical protein